MYLMRDIVLAATPARDPVFDESPIQLGLGECPWRVAVASMLLCRTRRTQMEPVLKQLFSNYQDAPSLARAELQDLESVVRPCGLQRNRARQLQRFSVEYLGAWSSMEELTGVGIYVADAVRMFCFGHRSVLSEDSALLLYSDRMQGCMVVQRGLEYAVYNPDTQSTVFTGSAVDAVKCFRLLKESQHGQDGATASVRRG